MGLVLARIEWALAHPCPLRDPNNSYGGEVGYAATHSDALRCDIANPPYVTRQAYQDIYLLWDSCKFATGSLGSRADGRGWAYPAWGFSVDRRYRKQGGWKGLQMLCGSCPACSTIEVVGCTGGFSDDDHDEEYGFVEDPDPFDLLVEEQGLRGELARYFPVTTPLWFGLWIQPIMPAGGVSVLRQLFETMERNEGSRNGWELFGQAGFLRALKTAERNGLELHVHRTAGGTIAGPRPHCPRCKAGMELGENLTCKVCGNVCSPQVGKWGTGRRAPLKPLLKELGEARFIELVRWSLLPQKAPEAQLDELMEAILERERTRPVWEAEKKQSLKAMIARARVSTP